MAIRIYMYTVLCDSCAISSTAFPSLLAWVWRGMGVLVSCSRRLKASVFSVHLGILWGGGWMLS